MIVICHSVGACSLCTADDYGTFTVSVGATSGNIISIIITNSGIGHSLVTCNAFAAGVADTSI